MQNQAYRSTTRGKDNSKARKSQSWRLTLNPLSNTKKIVKTPGLTPYLCLWQDEQPLKPINEDMKIIIPKGLP